MKFVVLLSMLFAGNAFAADGDITCSLTNVVNGKSTVAGQITVPVNLHGTVESNGYMLVTYVTMVCESSKPCTGYEMISILSKGEVRMNVRGQYTKEESGKVFAGELMTENDSAIVTCTVE